MGKRILVQRRGRGSPVFRALSHRRKGKARYLPLTEEERSGIIEYTIIDFVSLQEPLHSMFELLHCYHH